MASIHRILFSDGSRESDEVAFLRQHGMEQGPEPGIDKTFLVASSSAHSGMRVIARVRLSKRGAAAARCR